jgi:hypothetical protein
VIHTVFYSVIYYSSILSLSIFSQFKFSALPDTLLYISIFTSLSLLCILSVAQPVPIIVYLSKPSLSLPPAPIF